MNVLDLSRHGFTVDDDPVLVSPDGTPVDTWREGYPYAERMTRDQYEMEKRLLQIELLKLQKWIKSTGRRLVMVFEGRGRQRRNHQALCRTPQSPRSACCGTRKAQRA